MGQLASVIHRQQRMWEEMWAKSLGRKRRGGGGGGSCLFLCFKLESEISAPLCPG